MARLGITVRGRGIRVLHSATSQERALSTFSTFSDAAGSQPAAGSSGSLALPQAGSLHPNLEDSNMQEAAGEDTEAVDTDMGDTEVEETSDLEATIHCQMRRDSIAVSSTSTFSQTSNTGAAIAGYSITTSISASQTTQTTQTFQPLQSSQPPQRVSEASKSFSSGLLEYPNRESSASIPLSSGQYFPVHQPPYPAYWQGPPTWVENSITPRTEFYPNLFAPHPLPVGALGRYTPLQPLPLAGRENFVDPPVQLQSLPFTSLRPQVDKNIPTPTSNTALVPRNKPSLKEKRAYKRKVAIPLHAVQQTGNLTSQAQFEPNAMTNISEILATNSAEATGDLAASGLHTQQLQQPKPPVTKKKTYMRNAKTPLAAMEQSEAPQSQALFEPTSSVQEFIKANQPSAEAFSPADGLHALPVFTPRKSSRIPVRKRRNSDVASDLLDVPSTPPRRPEPVRPRAFADLPSLDDGPYARKYRKKNETVTESMLPKFTLPIKTADPDSIIQQYKVKDKVIIQLPVNTVKQSQMGDFSIEARGDTEVAQPTGREGYHVTDAEADVVYTRTQETIIGSDSSARVGGYTVSSEASQQAALAELLQPVTDSEADEADGASNLGDRSQELDSKQQYSSVKSDVNEETVAEYAAIQQELKDKLERRKEFEVRLEASLVAQEERVKEHRAFEKQEGWGERSIGTHARPTGRRSTAARAAEFPDFLEYMRGKVREE